MQIRATLACFLLLGCTCFGATPGQSSESAAEGVLLGFSTAGPTTENHYAAQQLSTAWIVRDKGTARMVIIPFLAVPRANGFWRVGIESVCEMYGDKMNSARAGISFGLLPLIQFRTSAKGRIVRLSQKFRTNQTRMTMRPRPRRPMAGQRTDIPIACTELEPLASFPQITFRRLSRRQTPKIVRRVVADRRSGRECST